MAETTVQPTSPAARRQGLTPLTLALLVIPELKLSDRGLFDGAKFEFTDLLK